jgi:hypothetical protein
MTKEELLLAMEQFDQKTLEKLLTIGNSILSPLNTELVSVDFAAMVDQVFKTGGLADTYFPEWTDRSKSDFGRFVVELAALFSDKDFFYQNHYSREAFVGKAELYKSLMHHAVNAGFTPPSLSAASCDVDLVFAAGGAADIPRGAIILGLPQFPSLVFTNDAFSLPLSGTEDSATVTFRHGEVKTLDGYFDGYSIFLNDLNVVMDSIVLKIDSVEWTQVETFINSTSSDTHFRVFYDELGQAEILFGNGTYGKTPDKGIYWQAEYLAGGGTFGNIQQDTLSVVLQNVGSRTLLEFRQFAATGGNDILPLERLREQIVGRVRSQNRIVTSEDAVTICKSLSWVLKAKGEAFSNYLYLYVLPTGGTTIDNSQKAEITALVEPALLMGYFVSVGSAIFTPLTLEIDLYLLPKTSKLGANAVAQSVIENYLNPQKGGEFGAGVVRSVLSGAILSAVNGSSNVVFKKLYRTSQPTLDVVDFTAISNELIDWDNSDITINILGGI